MKIKNLFYGVLVVLSIILFSSCRDGESGSCINTAKADSDNINSSDRVILKSDVYFHNRNSYHYQILEIDGHEYLSNTEGGQLHLESCICKQNELKN